MLDAWTSLSIRRWMRCALEDRDGHEVTLLGPDGVATGTLFVTDQMRAHLLERAVDLDP